MKIETKFNWGQEVYYLDYTNTRVRKAKVNSIQIIIDDQKNQRNTYWLDVKAKQHIEFEERSLGKDKVDLANNLIIDNE